VKRGPALLLYSMGFVVATGGRHGVGIAVGLIHRWPWGQTLLRTAGAAVALAGVFFMWRAIA
jgi:urease accessory protein